MRIYLKIITVAIIAVAIFSELSAARKLPSENRAGLNVPVTVPSIPASPPKPEDQALQFMSDLDMALVRAKTEYRPVFLLFSSPECQWCVKLKDEIFRQPEIKKLLKHFVLVDVDVRLDNSYKWNYMVQAVPTMIFLSSEGRQRSRIDGFTDLETLKKTLVTCSGNSEAVMKNADFENAVKMLESENVPENKWPEIMILLGRGLKERKELSRLIFRMDKKPLKEFVKMLSGKQLAVRLGALEILEELAGDDFSFDPWSNTEENSTKNMKAIEKWNEWAGNEKTGGSKIFSALTDERCRTLLNEIINAPAERAARAARALESGGDSIIPVIRKFLGENPGLPEGSRKKVFQVLYTIILSGKCIGESAALAHKLLFGNIDTKLKAIRDLIPIRTAALPILTDFLASTDSIVREAAVDAIAETGLRQAGKILACRFEVEKDHEVKFAILRGFGKIRSIHSGAALIKALSTISDEDLVITSLNSLKSIKAYGIETNLEKCLNDERWRVRAAALECVEKCDRLALEAKVEALLDDKDQFIRSKAVSVIAKISKGSSGAAAKLASMYFKDDAMKAPVLKALCSMNIKINKSFVDALDGKDAQTLNSIAGIISGCNENIELIARKLATHENPDISYPAIGFIAEKFMNEKTDVETITDILRGSDNGKKLAALSKLSFRSDNKLFAPYFLLKKSERDGKDSYFNGIIAGVENKDSASKVLNTFEEETGKKQEKTAQAAKGNKASPDVNDIFGAFEETEKKQEKPVQTAKENNNPDVNDIFSAFDEQEKRNPPVNKSAPPENPPEKLLAELGRLFKKSNDEEIKINCARFLVMTGNKDALEYVKKNFSSMPEDEKMEILEMFMLLKGEKIDYSEIINIALADSNPDIRYEAVSCIFRSENLRCLKSLFEKLDKNDPALTAYDIMKDRYSFKDAVGRQNLKKFFRKWAMNTLSSEKAPDMSQILALVILASCWEKDDAKLISEFFKSPNQWIRREAFTLMLGKDERAFVKQVPEILGDTSEYVRMVIPEGYLKKANGSDRRPVYFNEKSIVNYYGESNFNNYRQTPIMSKKIQDALRKLMKDTVPRVRLEAFFTMLQYAKPIKAEDFSETLALFPDQDAIAERIGEMLEENYKKMGPETIVLLPYLDKSRNLEEKEIRKIYAYFKKDYESLDKSAADTYLGRTERDGKEDGSKDNVGNRETASYKAVATEKVKLVYFSKRGCKDCEKGRKMLNDLKQLFPEMEIEEHDIDMVKTMKLNEAYCERFNVPENIRLVAPAVFAQGGYLIKGNIGFDSLGKLLADSLRHRDREWYIVMPDEMISSEKRISERYGKFSVAVIISAGFLDGINPCAFATIIFFLSYLAVARRNPREIFYVGVSFIAGVFIAYISLGFGFLEILGRISAAKSIGKYFNYAVALMALAIMLLSIYDGIMCMRGKMEKMSLQLPEFLKEKIRYSIRVSMKMRHFVIAAFVTGIIVSLLELACTGQVYAPTLLFMLKSGANKTGALKQLFLYNFAFIIPLCVVFGFAYFGVRSETFIALMRRHTVFVKFATAFLFMCLFILLLIF